MSLASRALDGFGAPRWGGVLLAVLILANLAFTAAAPVVDPDVWWIAAAGREVLSTHHVPTHNVFSYVDAEQPWIMHEWLLGPLYAAALGALGPGVFALLALLNATAVLALVVPPILASSRKPAAGYALALLAVGAFGSRLLQARPSAIALLFPVALLRVAMARPFGAGHAALAVGIVLVWTNAHGSFPLGVAMLCAAAAFAEPTDRRPLAAAAAASAAVTIVNPYGLDLHRFVYGYFRGTEGIHAFIAETIVEFSPIWRAPPSAIGALERVGFVAMAALAVAALLRPAHRARGAASAVLVWLAASHVRHIELSGLLACVLLAPVASDLVERVAPDPSQPAPRWTLRAPLAAGALGAAIWMASFSTRTQADWIAPEHRPVASLIDALPDGARAFVPFHSSGLAIWRAAPRSVRVFADPRNDCYRVETARAFHELNTKQLDPERAVALLDERSTTHAIVATGHPLDAALASSSLWRVARSQDGWCLYERVPSG